jgi:hydrogenase maturation protein HypF
MCRDLQTAALHCHISGAEAELLKSPQAPAVLLQKKEDCALPWELAPGLDTLGVLLPYTPLHMLLLQQGPPVLVMTSGNRSGLPLVTGNHRALEELGGLADYFLCHDRDIVNRCDDSVTAAVGGKTLFFRRSRGFVPQPLPVPLSRAEPVVLGIGGDMKNAFCLVREGKAFFSQHVGEVDTLEGQENLVESIKKFCSLTGIEPAVVTGDLHPGYRSSRLADDLAAELKARRHPGVQHHHAHMASCMAENGVQDEVIGIVLDGTGYGLDGSLWGFEVMRGDYRQFTREYHLASVPLPGGERAIRSPWLAASAYLIAFKGVSGKETAGRFFPDRREELAVVEKMLSAGFNSPLSSSCGRLFDAVAALLGLCLENTYEGEAAVKLGSLVPWFPSGPAESFSVQLEPYPFTFRGSLLDPAPVLSGVIKDIDGGVTAPVISRRFHDTVIAMVVEAAEKIRAGTGLAGVALSGGAWQNRYLSGVAGRILGERGFTMYRHHLAPPGDGGLALGQAMVAAKQGPHPA